MVNEEIRLNYYCKSCRNYDKGCDWLRRGLICNEANAYGMALGEKDQQFKEYLEKKMVELSSRRAEVGVVPVTCQRFIMEIINELFGETTTNTDREE